MKVIHCSDLHGHHEFLRRAPVAGVDALIISGDWFPNDDREPSTNRYEKAFQERWFRGNAEKILRSLRGVPVLWLPGNHDYANFGQILRERGYPAVDITRTGVEFGGRRFAGFGEIPIIDGFWSGESTDEELSRVVAETIEVGNPEILVTHAPPQGILDGGVPNYGVAALSTWLNFGDHQVRHHFFGHVHECGGESVEKWGVQFHNGATCVRVYDV